MVWRMSSAVMPLVEFFTVCLIWTLLKSYKQQKWKLESLFSENRLRNPVVVRLNEDLAV